jgi:hypothetical protein
MSPNLFEIGIGHLVISRFKSGGRVEAGVFLVDVYCLGVKDGYFVQLHESEYEDRLLSRVFKEGREPLTPACARKLLEGAVAYARQFGLEPHADYKAAAKVLGGISVENCSRTFTYGKDGKAFYVQGPYDSPSRASQIMHQLRTRAGEGNYHFLVELGSTRTTEKEEDKD